MTEAHLPFAKYHGCGNDYLLVDHADVRGLDLAELARQMSDRHTGVGADGLIAVERSAVGASARMHMFNADGSRGMMCGNGVRLVGKWLGDAAERQAQALTIATDAGLRDLRLFRDTRGDVAEVEVDMGRAEPLTADPLDLDFQGRRRRLRCLSLGNVHAVLLAEVAAGHDLDALAALLSRHPAFSDGVNVGWARRGGGPDAIELVVHERGSGRTLACGTGACAAFRAARDECWVGADARVKLPGGELRLREGMGGHILMSGPAVLVFRGVWPNT